MVGQATELTAQRPTYVVLDASGARVVVPCTRKQLRQRERVTLAALPKDDANQAVGHQQNVRMRHGRCVHQRVQGQLKVGFRRSPALLCGSNFTEHAVPVHDAVRRKGVALHSRWCGWWRSGGGSLTATKRGVGTVTRTEGRAGRTRTRMHTLVPHISQKNASDGPT